MSSARPLSAVATGVPAGSTLVLDATSVLTGVGNFLRKEAGWSDQETIGFFVRLAPEAVIKQASWTDTAAHAASSLGTSVLPLGGAVNAVRNLPKLDPGHNIFHNIGEYGNALVQGVRDPATAARAVNIATSSPEASSLTNHAYTGNTGGMLSDGWNMLQKHLPQKFNEFMNSDFIKNYGPTILGGLGSFAAAKLTGMGTGSALGLGALGAAGTYALPKLYEGLQRSTGNPNELSTMQTPSTGHVAPPTEVNPANNAQLKDSSTMAANTQNAAANR